MTLPFAARRTRQPQQAVRLDWSHPLAKSLALAWVASAGDLDLVTGKSGSTEGTRPANQAFVGRIGRKFSGNGDISFGTRPDLSFSGLSNQTLFAEVFIPDTSSVSNFICGRVQSNWDYSLSISSANQQFAFGTGGLAGGNAVLVPATSVGGGLAPYQGRPVPLCGTYDKVTAKLYVDGILKNSAALTGSFPNDTDQFAIGSRGGGNQAGQQLSGAYVSIVLIFKRTLSDAEVASLSANPWQLFAAPRMQLAIPSASGGTTLDLNPGVATMALAGFAPTVTQSANQSVVPSVGTLALAGFAPTVARTANQAITPNAGQITLAGFAPTLTQTTNKDLRPGVGGFSFTGYAPTVQQGPVVAPPVVASSTIMRNTPQNASVALSAATLAAAGGTMASQLNRSTILRQSAINNSSVLRDDALNQTVEFL
jgi:hypothetical protein